MQINEETKEKVEKLDILTRLEPRPSFSVGKSDVFIEYWTDQRLAWLNSVKKARGPFKNTKDIYLLEWIIYGGDNNSLGSFESIGEAEDYIKRLIPEIIQELDDEWGEQSEDSFHFKITKSYHFS